MKKFTTFASAFGDGTLTYKEVDVYVNKILMRLVSSFEDDLNAWTVNPTAHNKKMMDDSAGELVSFKLLLDVGDKLTDSTVEWMYKDALKTPSDPMSEIIIELYDRLSQENALVNAPTVPKVKAGKPN